jgi:hypothetical protein
MRLKSSAVGATDTKAMARLLQDKINSTDDNFPSPSFQSFADTMKTGTESKTGGMEI